MNITPDFSIFLQHDRQLDNVIFARHVDQETIACNNECLETTLLKETSRTLQSLSKAIQASMMTSKRKLGLIKEGSRMKITPFERRFPHATPVTFKSQMVDTNTKCLTNTCPFSTCMSSAHVFASNDNNNLNKEEECTVETGSVSLEHESETSSVRSTSQQSSTLRIKHFSFTTSTSIPIPAIIETSHFKGDTRNNTNNENSAVEAKSLEHDQCDDDFQERRNVIFQGSCKSNQNHTKIRRNNSTYVIKTKFVRSCDK